MIFSPLLLELDEVTSRQSNRREGRHETDIAHREALRDMDTNAGTALLDHQRHGVRMTSMLPALSIVSKPRTLVETPDLLQARVVGDLLAHQVLGTVRDKRVETALPHSPHRAVWR